MDTPKLTHGRDYEALIGIAMDHGNLRGDGVFTALGKNLFDLGVRAGNDVY